MPKKPSYQELQQQYQRLKKELSCIYKISHLVEQDEKLPKIIQGTTNIMAESWQYPDITCVKIELDGQEYKTDNYVETRLSQKSDLIVYGSKAGYIEVGYLQEKPKEEEGPFLEEERHLLDAVAERLGRIIERKTAQKNLQKERNYLKTLIEASPAAITKVDKQGKIVYANNEAEKVLELEKSNIKERTYNHKDWQIKSFDGDQFLNEKLPFEIVRKTKETVYDIRHTIEPTEGDIKYLTINASPLLNENNFEGMVSVIQDITEAHNTQKKLKKNERKFRSLYESMDEGACIHELLYNEKGKAVDYKIIDINPRYEEILTINREEVIGKLASEVYNTEKPPYLDIYAEVVETGLNNSFETFYKPLNKYFNISVGYISKNQFATVFFDLTYLIESKLELKENEINLRTTLNSIGDAVISTDLDGNIVRMNPIAEKLTGWNRKEAHKKPVSKVFNIVNSKDRESVENPVDKVIKQGKIVGLANHTVLISKDGTEYQIADSAAPIKDENGNISGAVLVFRDITDKYRTRQEIYNTKELLESTMNAIPDAIGVLDSEFNVIRYNTAGYELLNKSPQEVKGRSCYQLIGRSEPCKECAVQRSIHSKKIEQVERYEEDLDIWVNLRAYPIINDEGEITKIIEHFQDITKYKKLNKELQNKEKDLRTTLNSIGDAVISTDLDGNIVRINPIAEELTGWSKNSALGKSINKVFDIVNANNRKKVINPVDEVLKKEKIVGLANHTVLISKEGNEYQIADSGSPIKDEKGQITGVVLVFRDVTEEYERREQIKRSEERLREYKDRLEGTMKVGNLAWWEMDIKSGKIIFNQQKAKMLGYEQDQFNHYEDFTEFIHPQDYDRAIQSMRDLLTGEKKTYKVDYRIETKDGNYKWFHDIGGITSRYEDGKPKKVTGVVVDITGRKKAEEKLQKSESKFKTAFKTSPDSINLNRLEDGVYVDINKGFTDIMGYKPEDVIGKSSLKLNIWKNEKDRHRLVKGLKEKGYVENLEAEFIAKDGSIKNGLMSARIIVLDNEELILSITRDITHRKQLEKKFTKVWDSAQDGMRLTDKNGIIIKVNPAFCDMVSLDKSELEGSPLSVIYKKDGDHIINKHCKRFKNHSIPEKIEDQFQLHNGNYCWLEVTNSFVKMPNEEKQVLAIFRNVTASKNAEEKLKESEQKYRTVFENTGTATIIVEKDQSISLVNKEFEKLSGFSKEEIENTNRWIDFVDPEDLKRIEKYHKARRMKNGDAPNQYEFDFTDRTGSIHTVIAIVDMIPHTKKSVASFLDITNLREAEKEKEKLHQQLLQTQKLESIGTLAGGVAHDFNNILTVIIGLTEMILSRHERSDPSYDHLESILDAGKRAADLTKKLLLFSRKEDMEFELLDVNLVIAEIRKMLNRLIGEDIDMNNDLDGSLWSIRADNNQIEQVITNLVVNARDAMPEGGELTIRTRNVIIDEEKAKTIPDIKPGEYIRLCVEDTGKGIPKEIQEKIFDPFFTTKGRAEGTGMGLSVVHGIVKEHGGVINVYSEPDEGTVIKIYLPAVKEKSKKEQTNSSEQYDQYEGSGETILIVEDEAPVLKYLESILDNYGYNYISVKSGEEALQVFTKREDEIDLLISDVIMTGIDGVELANRIKEEKPDLKIILSSGYSNKKVAKSKIKDKGYKFIQKPYDILNLLKRIHETINNA